ncbi:uncharacterized protein LOC118193478 [Stegodyphus dumicola]|uniref:uncharacterized protein LOC118193478 n=1 Tax=Stegodyphus dumicola TaxID=202533 RepID=UPI0015AAB5E8|nr:uncharacterized protein LOC118193478 [Stegodyphus dumicola]
MWLSDPECCDLKGPLRRQTLIVPVKDGGNNSPLSFKATVSVDSDVRTYRSDGVNRFIEDYRFQCMKLIAQLPDFILVELVELEICEIIDEQTRAVCPFLTGGVRNIGTEAVRNYLGLFEMYIYTVEFEQSAYDISQLVVFDNYSEPADLLRSETDIFNKEDDDPLYMAPVDDKTQLNWQASELEEDMYCVPYEDQDGPPPLPAPCLGPGRSTSTDDSRNNSLSGEDTYDVVPDLSGEYEYPQSTSVDDIRPGEEYDEPWEWSVGARLTSSLQVSPSSPGALSLDTTEDRTYSEPAAGASSESLLSDSESCCDEDEMTARQRRLYETAFDSRVKRDADDLDRLMQSPVLQGDLFNNSRAAGEGGQVVRAASRSSFGSTSGSSASSTPTHQPMVIARQSPRQRHLPLHFTPTERRKVTLIRDHLPRSSSPQARLLNTVEPKGFVQSELNRNGAKVVNSSYERKISFNNQWDNVSRCSSDKSSSQESMNVVDPKDEFRLSSNNSKNEQRNFLLAKSASRDNLVFRDDRRNLTASYPTNWKELTNAKLENSNGYQKNVQDIVFQKDDSQDDGMSFVMKKSASGHTGVKSIFSALMLA